MPDGDRRGFSPALKIALMIVSIWITGGAMYFYGPLGLNSALLFFILLILLDERS